MELDIDDPYLAMLEQIEAERDDVRQDLARAVEDIIHENYQAVVGDDPERV